jgi:hypothetical protein
MVTVPPFDIPMYESVLRAVYDVDWAVTTCDTTIEDVAIGLGRYDAKGATLINVLVERSVTEVEGPKVASR